MSNVEFFFFFFFSFTSEISKPYRRLTARAQNSEAKVLVVGLNAARKNLETMRWVFKRKSFEWNSCKIKIIYWWISLAVRICRSFLNVSGNVLKCKFNFTIFADENINNEEHGLQIAYIVGEFYIWYRVYEHNSNISLISKIIPLWWIIVFPFHSIPLIPLRFILFNENRLNINLCWILNEIL